MPRVLFFDFQYSGHHVEYVNHLVSNIGAAAENSYFAVPAELRGRLTASTEAIKFIDVPDFAEPIGPALFRKQGDWIVETALAYGVEMIFFLNLDPYQYVIGTTGFRRSGLIMSGILFSPPHRIQYEEEDGLLERLKHFIRRNRKRIQLHWMLRNPNFQTAFLLDDPDVANVLGSKYTNQFSYLPDPIPQSELSVRDAQTFKRKHGLPQDCLTLLSFGTIVPRKNLLTVIRALKDIKSHRVGLVILGKGDIAYVNKLCEEATIVNREGHHFVVVKNEFITNAEMNSAFASANIVLAVYRNFFCSSGIIGHAAKYKVPILATANGVIGRSVEGFGLGVTCGSSRSAIVQGLQELLSFVGDYPVHPDEFLDLKTIDNFTAHIMADVGFSTSSNKRRPE